jgi:hypothetical protein
LPSFPDENPFPAWLGSLVASGAIATAVKLTGGVGPGTILREHPLVVLSAAVLVLFSGLLVALSKGARLQRNRRRWFVLSEVVLFCALVLYATGSVVSSPGPSVAIHVAVLKAGKARVTITASGLSGGKQMRVRADWVEDSHSEVADHGADGHARVTFDVGPLAKPERLKVIAFVTGTGHTTRRYTCGSDSTQSCADTVLTIRTGQVPDLRTQFVDGQLTIQISKQPNAPGPVFLFVTGQDHEIMKNHVRVDQKPYKTTLKVTGTKGGRVCVLATFEVQGPDLCTAGSAGVVDRYRIGG